MVRPSNFGFNADTAENNAFQVNDSSLSREAIKQAAIKEFDAFVEKLRAAQINIIVIEERSDAVSTDSIFPNNWFSCHPEGLLITYPMFSPKRRTERDGQVLEQIEAQFDLKTHIRLEKWENNNQFLEGTGSMILDREHKIAYACASIRTDEALLDQFCQFMGFEKVYFKGTDKNETPIYHTNVMMALGIDFVIICLDCVKDEAEKANLTNHFAKTGKEIIEISLEQMEAFAGNMLQVKNRAGQPYLIMSTQAYESLITAQIQRIERYAQILHSDLTVIETYGGGSARCMMAEVFLSEKE
jgi:hypothetical protein